MIRLDLPLFLATSCAILAYFYAYLANPRTNGSLRHLLLLPVVSVGLAPSISLTVLRGLRGKGGFFERTPKFGVTGSDNLPLQAFLYRQKGVPYLLLNSLLFIYSLLPLIFAWERGTWYALPLFALFPAGFLTVILLEATELRANAGRTSLKSPSPRP